MIPVPLYGYVRLEDLLDQHVKVCGCCTGGLDTKLAFYLSTLCGSHVELAHVLHCRKLLKQRAMKKQIPL